MKKWVICIASLVMLGCVFQIKMAFDALLNQSTQKSLIRTGAKSSRDECNAFEGEWVVDEAYPLYKPDSCPYVEESFSCFANGRHNSSYTHWKWQPFGCNVPRFNGTYFLTSMKGKRMAFVGDSLSRNQWESMLCLLSETLPNKSRVFEIHGEKIGKHKGSYIFKFQDYEFHLEYYSSRFLVDEEYNNSKISRLRLDRVHGSHFYWRRADILVFTTGHWWTRGKTARGKNFYIEGENVHPKLNLMVAFTKAMKTWATWVDKYVDPTKTLVFLSGYSPGHYKGGKWNLGGECLTATQPISQISWLPRYPEKMPVLEKTLAEMKFPVKLLNITRLSGFRSDGHPSIYGLLNMHGYQDCSHWCLPGVPDAWNELLYAMIMK